MSNREFDHALGLQERRVEAARRYAARAGLGAPPIPLAAEDGRGDESAWIFTLRSGLPLGRPGRRWLPPP
eukprot:15481122-Alexandrium_andersonii.AAC.1